MGEARMRRLRGEVQQAAKVKGVDPNKAPYERTWPDDNKPKLTMGIAMLAAARVSEYFEISLEEAKARIWEDFDVQPMRIRVKPGTMAHAEHLADLHQQVPDEWRV